MIADPLTANEVTTLPHDESDTDILCEQLRLIDRTMDGYRWYAGDLVNAAVDHGLPVKDAARNAQIDNGLASQYRLMAQLYPDNYREELMDEYQVNWSILNVVRKHATKMAKQVGRDPDVTDAIQFLDHCSDNSIHTVNHYKRESAVLLGKPKPRKKLATIQVQLRMEHGQIETILRSDVGDLEPGLYECDVYEVTTC